MYFYVASNRHVRFFSYLYIYFKPADNVILSIVNIIEISMRHVDIFQIQNSNPCVNKHGLSFGYYFIANNYLHILTSVSCDMKISPHVVKLSFQHKTTRARLNSTWKLYERSYSTVFVYVNIRYMNEIISPLFPDWHFIWIWKNFQWQLFLELQINYSFNICIHKSINKNIYAYILQLIL